MDGEAFPAQNQHPYERSVSDSCQKLAYKIIVCKFRIGLTYPGYFFRLSGRKRLLRIQTPNTFHQALSTEYLVDAGYTAVKAVRRIKDRRIHIGDGYSLGQQIRRSAVSIVAALLHFFK